MKHTYLLLSMLLFLIASPLVFLANADSDTPFDLQFTEGPAFQFQEDNPEAIVLVTVQSGDLNGTGSYAVSDAGGWVTINPSTSGLLYVSSNYAQTWITLNGLTHSAPYAFVAGVAFTVVWTWTATPVLPTPTDDWLLGGDISLLLTYLQAGDYLGFIMACYTTRIGQLAYVLIILMFTVPLALRSQSITYVAIVWIILGGVFQTAVPLIGPATVIFEILGIGALIFKLFARE